MPTLPEGFVARNFEQILSDINRDQVQYLSPSIRNTPDTLIGVLNSIITNSILSVEDLAMAVSDNFSIDKAEGKWLDDLVALAFLERLPESATKGPVHFTGAPGVIVPAEHPLRDTSNNEFRVQFETIMTEQAASSIRANALSGPEGTVYSVYVGDRVYSSVTAPGFDLSDAMQDLKDQLQSEPGFVTQFLYEERDIIGGAQGLQMFSDDGVSPMNVRFSELFNPFEVSVGVEVRCTEKGPILVPAETVTVLDSPLEGVLSVSNIRPLSTGRVLETDFSLRKRFTDKRGSVGSGTPSAIVSSIAQVSGVTSISILINPLVEPDPVKGLPGNSFELIVQGGSDLNIGEVLFRNAPAGIQSVGNTSVLIPFLGEDYRMSFTRPLPIYFWVRVEYSTYGEEVFPLDGEDGIKNAVVSYFDEELVLDSDVIPKRVYGPIYSSVSGIKDLTVKLFATSDPGEEPLIGDYAEVTIPVDLKGYPVTDLTRVSVVEVP